MLYNSGRMGGSCVRGGGRKGRDEIRDALWCLPQRVHNGEETSCHDTTVSRSDRVYHKLLLLGLVCLRATRQPHADSKSLGGVKANHTTAVAVQSPATLVYLFCKKQQRETTRSQKANVPGCYILGTASSAADIPAALIAPAEQTESHSRSKDKGRGKTEKGGTARFETERSQVFSFHRTMRVRAKGRQETLPQK